LLKGWENLEAFRRWVPEENWIRTEAVYKIYSIIVIRLLDANVWK